MILREYLRTPCLNNRSPAGVPSMTNKIDLDTIAKEYAEGRISKEDFLYLHKMLTSPPAKKQSPVQQPQPPVLKPARPVKVTTSHSSHTVQSEPAATAAQQRRTIRPQEAHNVSEAQTLHHVVPHFLVPQQKSSLFGYVKRHHKEVVALLGTAGIFISMFYNSFHFPSVDSGNARVVVIQSKDEKQAQGLRTQDIKLIAELMMEDNSWNKDLINDFLSQWEHLSDNEKLNIKQNDWYNKFTAMLSQQIKITQTKAKTGDVAAIYNQQALLELADNLVFGNNKEAKQALAKFTGSDSQSSSTSADNPKGSIIDKSVSVEKPDTQPPQTTKINEQPQNSETLTVENAKSVRDGGVTNLHRISRQEIEDVINRFTVAFEAGHTQDLIALFPDDDYSSSFNSLNRIKKEYKELFRATQDRRLDLSGFFWEHDYDEARGTAKYRADIRKDGKSAGETVTANLDITLRRLLGKVYITDFKLSSRKIVAHAPQPQSRSAAAKNVDIKDKPRHPTPGELQDLVTQYVTAYETGDVKELMQLFANATWTTDRSGLVEMKQNYQSLFESTSGREMFVKNMDWDFKDKKALGTGDLTVTFHTKDKKLVSQKGKIRIVATRHGEMVRFTQMFHIVE
ncbi:MAG: hypothetical protein L0Z73_13480 [Gammaproteobacteria bacterium]|nr:hypothetical protein [Gammaproteobacteria bacterium]